MSAKPFAKQFEKIEVEKLKSRDSICSDKMVLQQLSGNFFFLYQQNIQNLKPFKKSCGP